MKFGVPELASSAAEYDTATEARAHIDEEIRKPCNLRNNFSPISLLAPEILSTIFIRCALDHHIHHSIIRLPWNLNKPFRDVPDWINVSYTCRYWRDVALNCPALWTYHFVVSLRWTGELLARSKQAPLKVCLRIDYGEPDSWWLGPFSELVKHADRFEDLNLCLRKWNTTRVLSMLSECSSGPYLRNLKISFASYSDLQEFLPFQGDTPTLCTLDLLYSGVPWRSFKLSSSMTTLRLVKPPDRFRENAEDTLAALRRLENLTELCLEGALISAAGFLSSPAFRGFQKVNLPHLSRLSIVAPLSTVVALLSCVNIPLKTAVLPICIQEGDTSPDHYTLLHSPLAQRFEDQLTGRSLLIRICEQVWMDVTLSSRERDCNDRLPRSLPGTQNCNWIPLRISYHHGSFLPWDHILSDFLCSMPLTNVQTLHFALPPCPSAYWREILGHLQHLRLISLVGEEMPSLASVLSVAAHEDVEDQNRDQTILVPRLEELKLTRLNFSSGHTVRQLFHALSSRNMPHGQLNMIDCMIKRSSNLNVERSWNDLASILVALEADSDFYC